MKSLHTVSRHHFQWIATNGIISSEKKFREMLKAAGYVQSTEVFRHKGQKSNNFSKNQTISFDVFTKCSRVCNDKYS